MPSFYGTKAGTEASTRLDTFCALFHMNFILAIVNTKEQQLQFPLNRSVSDLASSYNRCAAQRFCLCSDMQILYVFVHN